MLSSALKYYWWVLILGVTFLPNFYGKIHTSVGSAEQSDLLLIPLALSLYVTTAPSSQTLYKRLKGPLMVFLGIATLSTLTISLRYDYQGFIPQPLIFSIVKLGKFILYIEIARRIVAKLSTIRTLTSTWLPQVVVLACSAGSYVLLRLFLGEAVQFEADNAMSVYMATLISYLMSLQIHQRPKTLLPIIPITLGIGGIALLISGGRGGWFAAAFGILWAFYKAGISPRTLLMLAITLVSSGLFVWSQEEVYSEFMRTFRLGDPANYQTHHAETKVVDDGARLYSVLGQIGRLKYSPILGTGLFHRDGLSRLWWTGSHNFYVQMLLETGVLGFAALLTLSRKAWAQTRLVERYLPRISVATQSGLIAAFVGSMSGEYFYGGLGIFTIALVYAPVGMCIDARDR